MSLPHCIVDEKNGHKACCMCGMFADRARLEPECDGNIERRTLRSCDQKTIGWARKRKGARKRNW